MSPDPKLGAGPTIFLANMHVSWSIGSSRTGEGAMAKTRMILLGGLAIVAVAVGTVAVRTANFAPANLADGSDVTLAAAPAYDLDAAVRHLRDRKNVVSGTGVSVRLDLVGRRTLKKK